MQSPLRKVWKNLKALIHKAFVSLISVLFNSKLFEPNIVCILFMFHLLIYLNYIISDWPHVQKTVDIIEWASFFFFKETVGNQYKTNWKHLTTLLCKKTRLMFIMSRSNDDFTRMVHQTTNNNSPKERVCNHMLLCQCNCVNAALTQHSNGRCFCRIICQSPSCNITSSVSFKCI